MATDPRSAATEDEFYVEIVYCEDETVVNRRGPFSAWRANKIDDGLNINLNHEAYFTRIVGRGEVDPDA